MTTTQEDTGAGLSFRLRASATLLGLLLFSTAMAPPVTAQDALREQIRRT